MMKNGLKSALGITAVVLLLIPARQVAAQAQGTIVGTVTASESGGPLAGAQVSVQGTVRRTVTDAQGKYRLSIEPGTYTVQVTTLGRQTDRRQTSVTAGGTSTVNFSLSTSAIAIEAVVANAIHGSSALVAEGPRAIVPCPASTQTSDPMAASYCALLDELQRQKGVIETQQQAIADLQRRMDLLEKKQ